MGFNTGTTQMAKKMLQEPSWYAQELDALSMNAALAEGGRFRGRFHDCTLVLLWEIGHIWQPPDVGWMCRDAKENS